MSETGEHPSDELLSAAVDDRLAPDEAVALGAHLGACAECTARAHNFRAVVGLLRALPSEDPPRDFRFRHGQHLAPVGDPPNVVRLRRWYTLSRAGAASLAAAFVFLSIGALYVDSRPRVPAETAAPVAPRSAAAPASDAQGGAPTPVGVPTVAPAPARGAAAPAARSQAGPTPAASAGDSADQFAAATSVRALRPTDIPTVAAAPRPTQVIVAAKPAFAAAPDAAPPLRVAALVVGVLAAGALVGLLVLRRRLSAALTQP
jgi:hypothetical protein